MTLRLQRCVQWRRIENVGLGHVSPMDWLQAVSVTRASSPRQILMEPLHIVSVSHSLVTISSIRRIGRFYVVVFNIHEHKTRVLIYCMMYIIIF
jgi:hypothetical protein